MATGDRRSTRRGLAEPSSTTLTGDAPRGRSPRATRLRLDRWNVRLLRVARWLLKSRRSVRHALFPGDSTGERPQSGTQPVLNRTEASHSTPKMTFNAPLNAIVEAAPRYTERVRCDTMSKSRYMSQDKGIPFPFGETRQGLMQLLG